MSLKVEPFMSPLKKTAFWSALACVALLLLVLWWNVSGKKDEGRTSPAGKQQTARSVPKREPSRSLSKRLGSWSLVTGEQGSQAEKAWELRDVEEAVRRTFLAYNARDLPAFKAGWTDQGFRQAYELPKEKVRHFGLLGLLSFRPYVIGEFSDTWVDGKTATTEVGLTYGQVQETHRMALVREDDDWRIDHDEKLALIPQDATVVDVKLKWFLIELDQTWLAPGPVAFRITNADTRPHEFIVKEVRANSGTEENVGLINPLAPGRSETLVLNLTPGRYVGLCNLIAPDGRPYSTGMRTEFTVE